MTDEDCNWIAITFVAFLLGVIMAGMFCSRAWSVHYNDLQTEAVKRGFAERPVTPAGEVSWRWIDKNGDGGPVPCE